MALLPVKWMAIESLCD